MKLRTTNGAYITKPNNMPKNHQAVFQKELKYPNPESICKVAETLSGDLLSFCKSLLNNGSFQESKKGCIYMINRYLRHPNVTVNFSAHCKVKNHFLEFSQAQ